MSSRILTELWRFTIDGGAFSPNIGDVDNNGVLEIVVGGRNGFLYYLSLEGQELWSTKASEQSLRTPIIKDIDDDDQNEVVVATFDGSLITFRNNELLWRFTRFRAIVEPPVIEDVNGDGENEIIAGSKDHTLRVIKNGKELWHVRFNDWVYQPAVGDINGDGRDYFCIRRWFLKSIKGD